MTTPKTMRSPRALDLEITSRCNASCRYCYYLNNPSVDYSELPTATWLKFFEELAACQVMNVTLQGGEPLLREDFLTLVDGVVANRMRFSVLTNGSRLTPEVAEHLKGSGRCDLVQVSLDGSSAEVHEPLRGKGTFAPALAAIRVLLSSGLPTSVRVTVHPGNLDDLDSVARLLLDELNLPSFSTNAVSSLGSSAKYDADCLLTPGERLKAMRVLAHLDAVYPGRIHANAGPLADWRMFRAMEEARVAGKPLPGRGRLVGCGCIFDRLAVRADGAIIPCVMLPQLVLGQVGTDSLVDVWQTAAGLTAMRERVRIPLDSFETCRDCAWARSCTGNCPGTAFALGEGVNRPCPATCLKRFHDDVAALGESLWM